MIISPKGDPDVVRRREESERILQRASKVADALKVKQRKLDALLIEAIRQESRSE